MKKISQIFSNYQKNSNIDSNEVNKKYFESLKKETEEYNEESMEESETNPTMNENEIIYPNDVQSTNITKPNYQLKEQNLEFGIIQCSSNQGTFSPFKLSVNNIDKKYKTWISSEYILLIFFLYTYMFFFKFHLKIKIKIKLLNNKFLIVN